MKWRREGEMDDPYFRCTSVFMCAYVCMCMYVLMYILTLLVLFIDGFLWLFSFIHCNRLDCMYREPRQGGRGQGTQSPER